MPLDVILYDHLVGLARQRFSETGRHATMLFASSPGNLHVIPIGSIMRLEPRARGYAVLRHLLKLIGADSYVVTAESWQSVFTGRPPSPIPSPEQDPKRQSILLVIGVFADGTRRHTLIPISDGKIVGPASVMSDSDAMFGGALSNLLGEDRESEDVELFAEKFAKALRDLSATN